MTLAALPLALALAAARAADPAGASDGARPDAGTDPWAIGESAVAPAGALGAPLRPEPGPSHWRTALGTGIAFRKGGEPLASTHDDRGVLLYFGGQADGLWTEGLAQALRLRARIFTGGEAALYVPSEGDLEAAYSLGRRALRFVVARVEVGRYPSLAVDALVQAGTLPSFEGSVSLDADRTRIDWFVSPVEAAWVRYRGDARVPSQPDWPSEADSVSAATALRVRVSGMFVPSVLVSAEGDLVKLWQKPDLLLSLEGSVGWEVLRREATLGLTFRMDDFTRRGTKPHTSVDSLQLTLLAAATLAF
jgi:hypothetical protein